MRYGLPPLLLCLFMAMLALACVGLVAYQAVLFITGATTWDTACFSMLLWQLGAVFFGIISLGFWSQYSDKDIQTLLIWLICSLLLEVSVLTGYATHYEYSASSELVNHGARVLGNITDVEMHSSKSGKSRFRKLWFTYEFHTSEGKLIKGKAGASYYWLTQKSLESLDEHRDNIPVLYLAENPQCSNIDNFWLLWDKTIAVGSFFTIAGSMLLFILYRLLRPTRRKPPYKKLHKSRRPRLN